MIDVIKQLVDALEWCHGGEPIGTADAIKAGKQLIAKLESQEPVAYINIEKRILEWAKLTRWETPTVVNLPKIPLYTHPPERTEPEPVAWELEWTFDGEEKGRRLYDDERQCKFDAENDGGVCRSLVYGNTAPSQRPRVVFPTMLRKMWSGGEVQQWLDENVNKENT